MSSLMLKCSTAQMLGRVVESLHKLLKMTKSSFLSPRNYLHLCFGQIPPLMTKCIPQQLVTARLFQPLMGICKRIVVTGRERLDFWGGSVLPLASQGELTWR